jgi:glc operon protein GlcG
MSITHQQAHTIIAAAHDHARELGLTITVAIVDAGGLLKALDRMDGAPPLSSQIAEAKAQGAAVWQRDGHVLAEVHAARGPFVDAVSRMTRLPLVPVAGSVCINDPGGAVIGAVGISGASSEEDLECARKGLQALEASVSAQ